jgi:uncharacterized membrane protein YhaH (DUF805 family)
MNNKSNKSDTKEYLNMVRYVLVSISLGVVLGFLFQQETYFNYRRGDLKEVFEKSGCDVVKYAFNYKLAFIFSAISIIICTLYSIEKYKNMLISIKPQLDKILIFFKKNSINSLNETKESIKNFKLEKPTFKKPNIKKTGNRLYNHFFKLEGRNGRLEFLGVNLLNTFLVTIIQIPTIFIITSTLKKINSIFGVDDFILNVIMIVVFHSFIYAFFCLKNFAKRLQDVNIDGKIAYLGFIPFLSIIPAFLFLFIPGSEFRNKYGDPV